MANNSEFIQNGLPAWASLVGAQGPSFAVAVLLVQQPVAAHIPAVESVPLAEQALHLLAQPSPACAPHPYSEEHYIQRLYAGMHLLLVYLTTANMQELPKS